MKCKECEYYYYGDTHDGLNDKPSCRKGYIPFVDVECKSFKKMKIPKDI